MKAMKMWKLSGLVLILTIARVAMAQELKKEFVDPQLQEARSTAVKIKGGTLVFLAGHTASQPRPDADLGNFDVQFKAVFEKIGNTLAKAGGNLDDIVSMSVFLTDLRYTPQFQKMAKEIFKKNFPAMTFIEVSHLARPQSVMEVQPIAVLP
ncbi:MAG: RidA family protein [Betaproteobacteria bacterium]|jgi:enamine deaminase RidA (YjgF/YER057c/UK114 family)